MRIGRYLFAALMVVAFAGVTYAAPVGLTSEADVTKAEWSYNDIEVSVGFVVDSVSERKIDIDSGDFEMDAFMARIGVSALDRFNFYVDLGVAQDMEYGFVIQGEPYRTEFDDEFLWGVGVNALIYRWDNGLEVGVNASYRQAEMNLDQATVTNIKYTKAQMTSINDGEFQEYQGALEVAWRTDLLTPYIGVKVSEVEVDADFTLNGTQRNASGKNAAENVGVFVGLEITPKLAEFPKSEQLAINLEGRFIDEEAFSVGVSYRF